jgi:hypothetical protein
MTLDPNMEAAVAGQWHAVDIRARDVGALKDDARAPIEWMPRPITELAPTAPPDWIWEGYIAGGASTLLTGFWKAGKTTLLSHLVAGITQGNQLVGEPREQPVLVISEESSNFWIRRREQLGLGAKVHTLHRVFKCRPDAATWSRFVEHAVGLIAQYGYCLVVFDTLASVWPVQNENDASEVLSALLPLHAITETGAGLLLIHHPRKGESSEAQGSRGSGALTGWVDVILEFKRRSINNSADCRRVIRAYSRYDETPPEVVLDFTNDNYSILDVDPARHLPDWATNIAEVLQVADAPLRPQAILARMKEPRPQERKLELLLKDGTENGAWTRLGKGGKKNPFTYIRSGCGSRTPELLSARTNPCAQTDSDHSQQPQPKGSTR